MELNLLTDITLEDIKKLEDELFATDPLLKDLISIRDIDGYCEFPDLD